MESCACTSVKDSQMTHKKMSCGKCGAGANALECRREHLGNGSVLLVVSCCLCGWRLERDERLHSPSAARLLPAQKQSTYAPCPVVGCGNRIVVEKSRSGFCFVCGGQWRTWQRNRHREPPLVLINGFWCKRQSPLIPGDPSVPPPTGARKRSSALECHSGGKRKITAGNRQPAEHLTRNLPEDNRTQTNCAQVVQGQKGY